MNNSPSALQVLGVVYGLLWCGSLARLGSLMPLEPLDLHLFPSFASASWFPQAIN